MTQSHQPDASVVVVSYNTRELLTACLESIGPAAAPVSHEVIVVDNASADGSAAMVASRFPNVRLVQNNRNVGFAVAINQALALVRGEYVLLVNSDAVLRPNAVGHMVEFMDGQPTVGVLGGQLFNPDGSFQSSYARFPNWKDELLLMTGASRWFLPTSYPSFSAQHSREPCFVDWVGGALFMVRRKAVEEVGRLDEDYFMYSEEMDLCYRMQRAGWKVAYIPQAQAVHLSGASAHRQPERRRGQIYRSRYLFIRKHWGPSQGLVFVILVRIISVLKMGAWWAGGALSGVRRRELATSRIASYRYLLSSLTAKATAVRE